MMISLGTAGLDFPQQPDALSQQVVWFTDRDKRVRDNSIEFFDLIMFPKVFFDNLCVFLSMLPYFMYNIKERYIILP